MGFIAPMPTLGDRPGAWLERLQRIEDLGFDEIAISEHYSRGWGMEPLAALAFGADAVAGWRERLGIGLWHLGSDIEAMGRVIAASD